MIQAKINNKIKFPEYFVLQDDLMEVAEKLFIPLLGRNIDMRQSIDGGSLPPLSKITIRMKGHDRPLIDTGELRRSFYAQKQGSNAVLVSIMGTRKDVGRVLQVEGVRSGGGRKFFRFFGISPTMENAAIDFIKGKIAQAIKAFNGK